MALIFDERVVLTGSVNMTHNGLENNKEHSFRITIPSVVADVAADFEKAWLGAEPVEECHIKIVLARHKKKDEERGLPMNSRTDAQRVDRLPGP